MRVVARNFVSDRQTTGFFDQKATKREAMQAKRTLVILAPLLSSFSFGPALARADTITTFDVSGQYSMELSTPAQGTFSGELKVDTDFGTVTAIDIKFDE